MPLVISRCMVALVLLIGLAAHLQAQREAAPVVFVAKIDGMIDLGLAPYVQRVLDEASAAKAAAVVLEINTFGGRVDAAVQIRDSLLAAQVPTVAYVNQRAISAGALIALAAEHLVMAPGATIGAAAPVLAGQPNEASQPAGEKTVSYVRKEFRATAERRKRPPLIAEAMVDADVEIKGLIEKGKLLTLTTDEALKHQIAGFTADSVVAALDRAGVRGAEVRTTSLNWAENVVRLLTHPVLSSLLVSVAILGILVELRTPGFGFPGAIGLASLAAFFWGHWLVQLAGWEEVLVALVGIALLLLELLVIPGFGVAGIAGLVLLAAALVMSVIGSGATADFIIGSATRMVTAVLVALIASFALFRFMPHTRLGRQLILDTDLHGGEGEAQVRWLGKRGRASTPLHPAGIAELDGERVDVVSEGVLIDPDTPVEVIRVEGNRVVVRAINNREGEVQ